MSPEAQIAEWRSHGLIVTEGPRAVLPSPVADDGALPAGLTEEQFQARVIALATRHGWAHYHTRDSRRSVAGWPDLILCRPPRWIVWELKVPPNKPTAAQREWLRLFEAVGAEAGVMYPDQWREVVTALG